MNHEDLALLCRSFIGAAIGAIIALLAIAACNEVRAEERFVLGANLISIHSKSGYETVTPGLYIRNNDPFYGEAGAYRNSQGFWSMHAGVGYSHRMGDFDVSITGGLLTGYREPTEWYYPDGSAPNFTTWAEPKTRWYVLPSAAYYFDQKTAVRTFVIPPVQDIKAWCVSFALERSF